MAQALETNITTGFPYGGGTMGAAIRAFDWGRTPLGDIDFWPSALRAALNLVLNSQESMFLIWGEGRTLLFNDAYIPTLGPRIDTALGRDIAAVWPDAWDQVLPVVIRALAGEGTRFERVPLTMARYGVEEQTWWTYSFSPLYGDAGTIEGMLGITREVTDDVLTAQRVKANNDALTQMFDQAPSFIAVLRGTEHRIELTNRAYRRLVGDRNVQGRTLAEALPDAAAQGYVALLDEVYKSGKPHMATGAKYVMQAQSGDDAVDRYVDFVLQPVTGTDGKVNGIFIEGYDVTARVVQNQELLAAQDQLRLAQEAGGVGLFTTLIDEQTILMSPEFCRIFGIPQSEKESTGLIESLCLPEDRAFYSNVETRAAGSAEKNVEYRIRRPSDGEIRWIARRAEFVRGPDGSPRQMVGIVADITERKTSEIALRESRQHLDLMLSSAREYAIISIGLDGVIVSWNKGAHEIFGHGANDMVGQHVETIFTPEDRAAGAPQYELDTAATMGQANDERWHERACGERFYASGIMTAMRDDTGNLQGFVKIARDMTRQKQAEEDLLEARNAAEAANIAKTEFLANMSHEIRTPMNAIIGLSNILAMTKPLTDKQRQFIGTLQTSADSLLALINDLLDISKIEARTVELEQIPFSLARIVQEVASMMAVRVREKGLAFTGNADCIAHRMFIGDPTRLRQIVLNLCSNAIKFTESGSVHVDIGCAQHDEADTETVCIAVTDTGIGIAPAQMDTIFQKFMQADTSINRKYGGTGLGLAITRTLAEIMGGHIAVESKPGHGSTFTVCIPLRVANKLEIASTDGTLQSLQRHTTDASMRQNILLVEDYEPNILVATTVLEQLGFTVELAVNGLDAVEMAKTRRFALIVMDVQMHGMNGLDATRLIRGHEKINGLPAVPIIGMTAHALAGDRERCLGAGMNDYVAKPFKTDDLDVRIRDLLKNAAV